MPPVHLPHTVAQLFGYTVNIRLLCGSVIQLFEQIAPLILGDTVPKLAEGVVIASVMVPLGGAELPVFGDIPLGGIVTVLKAIRETAVRNQGTNRHKPCRR